MGALRTLKRNLDLKGLKAKLTQTGGQEERKLSGSEGYAARSQVTIAEHYRKPGELIALGQKHYFRGKSYRGRQNKKCL